MTLAGCGNRVEEPVVESVESIAESTEEYAEESEIEEEIVLLNIDGLNTEGSLADVDVSSCVEIDDYSNLEITVEDVYLLDNEVGDFIESYASYYLQRPEYADSGEVTEEYAGVNISYTVSCDGVTLAEESNIDLSLQDSEYGTNLPTGAINNLLGSSVGETVEFTVSVPEEDLNEDYKGKTLDCSVTINSIYNMTYDKASDENASELAEYIGVEATDLASLELAVEEYMLNYYEEAQAQEINNAIINALIEKGTVKDVPEFLVNKIYINLANEVNYYAEMYNMQPLDYVNTVYGLSVENAEEYLKSEAKTNAEGYVICQYVANELGIEVSEEDVQTEIKSICEINGYSEDTFREDYSNEEVRNSIMIDRVAEKLTETATINKVRSYENSVEEDIQESQETAESDVSEAEESIELVE